VGFYSPLCSRTASYHAVLIVTVSLAFFGCQNRAVSSTELAPPKMITSAFGDYNLIAWVGDSRLVVQYEPEILLQRWTYELWSMRLDGSDMHSLSLPRDGNVTCAAIFFTSPTAMPDGRLAFERACDKLGTDTVDRHLLFWNVEDDTSGLLYDYEMPARNGIYTFAPNLSRGMTSSNTAIEDHLFWLNNSGAQEVELGMARANTPAWSPDGAFIAFWGNLELEGEPGPGWALQPYDLWLMPADCEFISEDCAGALQFLLGNVLHPNVLQWSPDMKWLAFDGEVKGAGQGVWLLNLSSRDLRKVVDGNYIRPVWSPDGSQIAVIGPEEQTDTRTYRSTLYLLDCCVLTFSALA